MNYFRIVIPVLLAAGSGCASMTPEPELAVTPAGQINYADEAYRDTPQFQQVRDNINAYVGRTVSWDGTVVRASNTEIEIQVRDTGDADQAAPYSAAQRRFVARSNTPLNPQQYMPGQPINITGTVSGNTALNFNGARTFLPTVAIATQRLTGRNNTATGINTVAYDGPPPPYRHSYPDYYYNQPRPRYYRYNDYYSYPWYYPWLRLGISLGYNNYHSSGFSYGIRLGL